MTGNKRAPENPPAPKLPQKRPRCAHPGCGVRPSFNKPDQARPLYCKTHITSSDMINVVNKNFCAHEGGCTRIPSRNFPGLKRPLMCLVHELPGMDDVKNPRCLFPGCKVISPTHNAPTETRGKYCAEHAEPDMINVVKRECAAAARSRVLTSPVKRVGCFA